MKNNLTAEELLLTGCLKAVLCKKPWKIETVVETVKPDGAVWSKMLQLAKGHAVLPLLCDGLLESPAVPAEVQVEARLAGRQCGLQSYRLLFMTKTLVDLLEQGGVSVLVLKGAAVAAYYPVPELRKAGDIDLLIPEKEKFSQACKILSENGLFRQDEPTVDYHISFETDEHIKVELHKALSEPFENRRMNYCLQAFLTNLKHKITWKSTVADVLLPVLPDAEMAFYLLIHMLRHFLRSGFGLKLLADWVVFWNRETDENEKVQFMGYVRESGLRGFCAAVTQACVCYLGLRPENAEFMAVQELSGADVTEFFREVMEAQEFGLTDKTRMVVLPGTGPGAYFCEFHYQMKIRYPRAGKVFLLWPVLWGMTLFHFVRNNKKLRRVSSCGIIRKAGMRSRILKKIHLFQDVPKRDEKRAP